ncbi:MAG: hypothetical protein HFE76_11675 [Firmicutes bacterium]|nr:hypothetical protein [Bacillota bacterium]
MSNSRELITLLCYFEQTTDAMAERSGSLWIRRMQEIVQSIKADENVGVKYVQAWEEKELKRQEGFQDGQFELLGRLVQKGTLTLDAAAEELNGKGKEFLSWYQAQKG